MKSPEQKGFQKSNDYTIKPSFSAASVLFSKRTFFYYFIILIIQYKHFILKYMHNQDILSNSEPLPFEEAG
ncbi:hypothetical protein DHL47_13150 [Streptococcus panodentis]|uniref:Uncharacterized protein n=1 Tax=Streptococcus panodentis TaxID=1581472 RepID=A0ABS5B082_9STRE|nr:hypothetical protein [Streptococcus panodentis]